MKVNLFSRVQLLATPWTAAYQAPPSMGLSRQEYWSGVPWLSPDICYTTMKKMKTCLSFKFLKRIQYDTCCNMDKP